MSIVFSEEQSMLLETAMQFCKTRSPIERVREMLDAPSIDAELYQEMADLGWLGVNVPQAYGGLGMGLFSVVPIAESMGRYLMGSAFVGSVVASEAIVSSGSEAQKNAVLPDIVAGAPATVALIEQEGDWDLGRPEARATRSGSELVLSGTKCFVADADVAKLVVASVLLDGKARLVLIERASLDEAALTRETVMDQTRRCFSLKLDGIRISETQLLPGADFAAIERAALLMLCAEISGGLSGCMHTIVDYLSTRQAFGRYIGSYQALKHPAVDILLSLEAARSLLYEAAGLFSLGDIEGGDTTLAMAKAQGSPAFAFAGDRAVQFHGGFGFTFECDAQLFLRRALWCQYQFGDEQYHRQRLAPMLLDTAG